MLFIINYDTSPYPKSSNQNILGLNQAFQFYKDGNEITKLIIKAIEEFFASNPPLKEEIKQKIIEKNEKIKDIIRKNKNLAPSYQEIENIDFGRYHNDKNENIIENAIVLPRLIICLGDVTQIIKEEILNNKSTIENLFVEENLYKKILKYLEIAKKEDLKKIIKKASNETENSWIAATKEVMGI